MVQDRAGRTVDTGHDAVPEGVLSAREAAEVLGVHERTIREFRITQGGISVGPALRNFRGILTGVPVYEGPSGPEE